MESFVNRGVRLEYTVSGSGKPLLFLHGMGGSVKQIESAYEPQKGVMLINMNQQGHGGSGADWETLDFCRLADDALALLDLLGIERAALAGISMGAAVSLNMAVRFPERVNRLILIRNAWADCAMSDALIGAYADLGRCLKSGGEEAFRKTPGWELVKAPSAYTRNAFLSPFSDESCLKNPEKYLILPSKTAVLSADDIRKITCPAAVVANRNDLCHPFELGQHVHGLIPQSEFIEIPDKDTDPAAHRSEMNAVIKRMMIF